MGRPYTVKIKASYSLEKSLTQLRHKVVNLILRKCTNYQEMGRSYIDEVGTKINMLTMEKCVECALL